jgi:hypothetical protein
MRKLSRLFVEHPETVGETYFQHLRQASGFAVCMFCGGLACLMHGLFPFMFERTGSDKIRNLHSRMVMRRSEQSRAKWTGEDHRVKKV